MVFGIPVLSSGFAYALYSANHPLSARFIIDPSSTSACFLKGVRCMLSRDEMTGLDWVLLGRVSSQSQKDNTSTTKQLENLKNEADEADGNIALKQ